MTALSPLPKYIAYNFLLSKSNFTNFDQVCRKNKHIKYQININKIAMKYSFILKTTMIYFSKYLQAIGKLYKV
jgi:hypothetical protein